MTTIKNVKALKELLDLVKEYSEHSRWSYTTVDNWKYCVQCIHCGVRFSIDEVEEVDDENQHEDGCLWRRIKEAYANLTNEGY